MALGLGSHKKLLNSMHKNHRRNGAIKLGGGGKNNCAPYHLNFDFLEVYTKQKPITDVSISVFFPEIKIYFHRNGKSSLGRRDTLSRGKENGWSRNSTHYLQRISSCNSWGGPH